MIRNEKIYSADKTFGSDGETLILRKIKKVFTDCKKTPDKYNFFDFRDDTLKIDFELKTRRIYKGQYPTIFFAKHKLETGRKRKDEGITDRIIYLFCFNKKQDPTKQVIYYWEDLGTDGDFFISNCGNYKRGDVAKPLINVDVNKLKLLRDLV